MKEFEHNRITGYCNKLSCSVEDFSLTRTIGLAKQYNKYHFFGNYFERYRTWGTWETERIEENVWDVVFECPVFDLPNLTVKCNKIKTWDNSSLYLGKFGNSFPMTDFRFDVQADGFSLKFELSVPWFKWMWEHEMDTEALAEGYKRYILKYVMK